ncbi:hypothetical protein B0H21DRAFT_186114 [Amylocystis lapponica]|nr:hypothetical protein B0H21DRAFT_186114 [Amylocystis lapponica]
MPVPVPLYNKQPAHPVIKINQSADIAYESSVFQHLSHSLPLPPQGPPPSLATREEWISSLPSWRRNKPRRIWEEDIGRYPDSGPRDFQAGLAVAGNAVVIKGTPAQACIPPVSTLIASTGLAVPFPSTDMYAACPEDVDEEMSGGSTQMNGWRSDDEGPTGSVSPFSDVEYDEIRHRAHGVPMDYSEYYGEGEHAYHDAVPSEMYPQQAYERGAFTPVIEDMSPDPVHAYDPASSPIGPRTPFAEYVDRVVESPQLQPIYVTTRSGGIPHGAQYAYQDEYCGAACYHCQAYQQVGHHIQAPAPEPVVTPTATAAYKKLAEPLSEWISSYVWKVCTNGMKLPSAYAEPWAFDRRFPSAMPSHVASSTHAMLLSTLLQPSAVFLALWYIVRLPVFFGPASLDSVEHAREIRFRTELLGEAHMSFGRDAIESYAPFRLILLGCMLANKWLDDHTFSNKTWHTISNVPIRSLNKLEELALDIFKYDLSISPEDWLDWLSDLSQYHASLSSPSCPQPISRPSSNPHIIVRKAIDTLLQAKVPVSTRHCDNELCISGPPIPIFVGLEDSGHDCWQAEHAYDNDVDVLEIDLDEDGPLREEYLPRRRVSGAGSIKRPHLSEKVLEQDRQLPPPAKWSPQGDEPIARSTRAHGQYVAPRPVAHLSLPSMVSFPQVVDHHRQAWSFSGYPPKQELIGRQDYVAPPTYHIPPPYLVGFDYTYPHPQMHTRSHSLSYNQAIGVQSQGRFRSYSQTRYDQGYSDVRLSENRYLPPAPAPSLWTNLEPSRYSAYHDRPFDFHQCSLKV